jgi:hypothetical protein
VGVRARRAGVPPMRDGNPGDKNWTRRAFDVLVSAMPNG